ncbi:MAG: hypothetical protein ACTSSB_15910, partial [Candidatus Heimdallarchaeota archaeon]
YLDAFLSECTFYILLLNPYIWDRIDYDDSFIEMSNDEKVVYLKDQVNRKFSRPLSTFEQLEKIIELINLEANLFLDDPEWGLLNDGLHIRHIFVHNFGKVNLKFQNSTNYDFEVGENFPLNQDLIENLQRIIRVIFYKLFNEISRRIFSKTEIDTTEIINPKLLDWLN